MKSFLRDANYEFLDQSAMRNGQVYLDADRFDEFESTMTASGPKCKQRQECYIIYILLLTPVRTSFLPHRLRHRPTHVSVLPRRRSHAAYHP